MAVPLHSEAEVGPATGARGATPLSPWVSRVYLLLGVACVALYLAGLSTTVSLVALVLPAVSVLAATELALRRNGPARRPWRYLQAANALALLGAVLRAAVEPGNLLGTGVADGLGVLSYLFDFLWLGLLLRYRDRRVQREAVADGVLVGIATLMLAWVLLVSPTLQNTEVHLTERLLTGVFPVLDAVLVFLTVRLSFVTPSKVPSMWWLLGALLWLMIGDLGYAVALINPEALQLYDAPYLVTYTLLGAAVLHPSMAVLTQPAVHEVRPLPRFRLISVGLAVVAPALLVLFGRLENLADRVVVAAGILVLAAVILWRTVRAVNQHAASELRLARQATHDSLTGLPNRVLLKERLASSLAGLPHRPGWTVNVLFLDLDGFKLVNDSWGHTVGDELLVAAAARLRRARVGDELVARVGGDEFVVIFETEGPSGTADPVADRIIRHFAEPFTLSIGEVFVTVSIGVARSAGRAGQITPEELVRDADTAMYRAKGEGRNRTAIFDASMRDSVTRQVRIEAELRRALDRDELQVYYQPIVCLSTGDLRGFEALIRWEHPERGLVLPGEFIPVVEDTDLIISIGALILRRAAAQLALWRAEQDSGRGLQVSVNVAARQLRDPGFCDLVEAVLHDTGLPPGALNLEITESTMVDDSEASRLRLTALRTLGVGLHVDDFGTGYSSLRYLKLFPVTAVKIDRAFVDGLGSDPDDEAIVIAVLAMTHALGLEAVAEGVETIEQRVRLEGLGCDTAQGYLFGRPLSASSASRLITWPSRVPPTGAASRKVTA